LLAPGRVAADPPTVQMYLQRVVIEYGSSVWADSALLLLTQLYFAQGDPAATVQVAERMRRDYPDSPLKPRAEFWGGRAYFDLRDDAHGCPLIQEALAGPGGGADVEFKNQVSFYAARCRNVTPTATSAVAESQPKAAANAGAYAVQVLAVKSAATVDDMLTRLKLMGFDARVVPDTSEIG